MNHESMNNGFESFTAHSNESLDLPIFLLPAGVNRINFLAMEVTKGRLLIKAAHHQNHLAIEKLIKSGVNVNYFDKVLP